MEALTPQSPVHFYDTNAHAILCGKRGAEHRSTKHARGVTCGACVGLLGERADAEAGQADKLAAP